MINAHVKQSHGKIVAEGRSYLDKQEYILLNARVKGGNSGGPILNKKGYAVGILVQVSMDAEHSSKFDNLGYGVAAPKSTIMKMLKGDNNPAPPVIKVPFHNLDSGGFRTLPLK